MLNMHIHNRHFMFTVLFAEVCCVCYRRCIDIVEYFQLPHPRYAINQQFTESDRFSSCCRCVLSCSFKVWPKTRPGRI